MSDTMDSIMSKLGGLAKKAREVGAQAIETVDRDGTVRETYAKGAERTRAYAKIAKLTLELNGENEELRKVYTEIGKLYFEQARGSAEGFFAPLFAQAETTAQKIGAIESEIAALKDTVTPESAERDIEVEIGAFDDIVSADEKSARGEE